jgi:predicted transglutaminase-like cysteine proteinase
MRRTATLVATVAMIGSFFCSSMSEAAFFSFPLSLGRQLERMALNRPTLPPMAHTLFCLRYQSECDVHGRDFRRRNIALTPARLVELNTVNRAINRQILPERNLGGIATEEWLIAPKSGDCNDYAVTKRHELLTLGWPSRALLLSEVVVPSGEHHLVLVVRTKDIDLVLDNLNSNLRPVEMTVRQYEWVRVESPYNPKFWASADLPRTIRMASIAD